MTYPNDNPYRNITLGSNFGTQEELLYRTYQVSGAYRTLGRLDLGLVYQAVRFQGYSDQMIFSANIDMGNNRAISARVANQSGKVNPYLAFSQSGGAGVEYFLILGDSNATAFRSSLILKVTVPVERFIK